MLRPTKSWPSGPASNISRAPANRSVSDPRPLNARRASQRKAPLYLGEQAFAHNAVGCQDLLAVAARQRRVERRPILHVHCVVCDEVQRLLVWLWTRRHAYDEKR